MVCRVCLPGDAEYWSASRENKRCMRFNPVTQCSIETALGIIEVRPFSTIVEVAHDSGKYSRPLMHYFLLVVHNIEGGRPPSGLLQFAHTPPPRTHLLLAAHVYRCHRDS